MSGEVRRNPVIASDTSRNIMRRYRPALLGYYGFGNLGDELLLRACLELFGRYGLERENIIVLSNAPEDTSGTFGVASVSRWRYRDVARVLRQSDSLVLGGGGLFQDTTSVMSCVWYWGIVRLAKFLGCKVFALGQSIGPLKSGLSRMLAGDALRVCRKVHVRDDASLRIAESLKCRDVIPGGDLVMTLKPRTGDTPLHFPPNLGGTIGGNDTCRIKKGIMLLNLRPCAELQHYTDIIAPHIGADTIGAALSDEDMKALASLKLSRVVRIKTLGEAQELWADACSAVGMRLHFGVLSRIFRTPLALMPYDVKVREFAGQSGVPCIDGEWLEPVMPREIPEDDCNAEGICREIISL